jgi:hypothetical protein
MTTINKSTPLEALLLFFALLFGTSTILLGTIAWLAWEHPEKGYDWVRFAWLAAAFLALTLSLACILAHFLRERLSGNVFTISNHPE